MTISPEQSRAARGLLGIGIDRVAEKSGVSYRAIANFEQKRTVPTRVNRAAIQQALELLGVEFLDNGGVKLRDDYQG